MIWVIGDIHGAFDPLKSLITNLRFLREDLQVTKLIFLGDYIDHGPSSKEVVDFLMNLEYECVFLMGNHEDLLLQYYDKSELFQKFGNVWFDGNGGQDTVNSFIPGANCYRGINSGNRDIPGIDEKYMSFFKSLAISHKEKVGDYNFVFSHGVIDDELMDNKNYENKTPIPIEEQLSIKTNAEYHEFLKKYALWIEKSLIWSRKDLKKKLGDFILMHGHTPVHLMEKSMYENLLEYNPEESCFPFFNFENDEKKAELRMNESLNSNVRINYGSLKNLISINLDTGSVYGKALTAVGFSEESLTENKLYVLRQKSAVGYREHKDHDFFEVTLSRG